MGAPGGTYDLLPFVGAVRSIPLAVSADARLICRCDDSADYVIKDDHSGDCNATTPPSEWFCTKLAEHVGIASPVCKIVRMPGGEAAFGSRWEGGILAGGNWWDRVKDRTIPYDDVIGPLSRIYAFDLFVHNADRHLQNFLVRESHGGGHVLLAMDYSRSWLRWGFPLPPPPMAPSESTRTARRYLSTDWGLPSVKEDEAEAVLERLRRTPEGLIQRILDEQPDNWLSVTARRDILGWWASTARTDRLNAISTGISDGSYL